MRIRLSFGFWVIVVGIGFWVYTRYLSQKGPAISHDGLTQLTTLPTNRESSEPQRPVPETAAQSKLIQTSEEFRQLTHEVYHSLPTRDDLKNLNEEEVHHTPDVLVRAGISLGEVAQSLHDNPSFAHEASLFYKQCASNEDFPGAVRSLCYANLKKLNLAQGKDGLDVRVPDEVRQLADSL